MSYIAHQFLYMIHPEFIFQDLFLYCTNEVPKNHNKLLYFFHGGETHFLMLAQTLIYVTRWIPVGAVFDLNCSILSCKVNKFFSLYL